MIFVVTEIVDNVVKRRICCVYGCSRTTMLNHSALEFGGISGKDGSLKRLQELLVVQKYLKLVRNPSKLII